APDQRNFGQPARPLFVVDPKPQLQRFSLGNIPPGSEVFFEVRSPGRLVAIPDGTSNTIMMAEAAEAVPWTKPQDIPFEPRRPLKVGGVLFSSGFNVAMCDGSARWVDTRRTSEHTIRIAVCPDDGIPLPPDWELDEDRPRNRNR